MKNKQTHKLQVFFLFFIIIGTLNSVSSCKKDGPARAEITVVNASGVPIAGATVLVHQDTIKSPVTGAQAVISDVQTTDSDGKSLHEFPLEAILNIDVSSGKLKASDYIRLEKSKTVIKTVVLK